MFMLLSPVILGPSHGVNGHVIVDMPPGQPGTIVRAEPDDLTSSDGESESTSSSGSVSDEGGIVIDFKGPDGGGKSDTRL